MCQYIGWVQYSSYNDGEFTFEWREEFEGSSLPSGWAVGTWVSPKGQSTHTPDNVGFVNGIAVLSLTADDPTGPPSTVPADGASTGGAGTGGTSSGGANTGGTATGGAPTGGTATGGAGMGGTSSGGATSTGGSVAGGTSSGGDSATGGANTGGISTGGTQGGATGGGFGATGGLSAGGTATGGSVCGGVTGGGPATGGSGATGTAAMRREPVPLRAPVGQQTPPTLTARVAAVPICRSAQNPMTPAARADSELRVIMLAGTAPWVCWLCCSSCVDAPQFGPMSPLSDAAAVQGGDGRPLR